MADPTWNISDLATPEEIADLPPINQFPDYIPFALPTIVLPPPRPFGASDMFVDDCHTATVDIKNYTTRAQVGLFATMNGLARLIQHGHRPRDLPLQGDKTKQLGRPQEIKLVGSSALVH
jgi:hypothetical protein